MSLSFPSEDYVLRWPRDSFRERLSRLLNQRLNRPASTSWDNQVELLLYDAFESTQPGADYRDWTARQSSFDDPWGSPPRTRTGDSDGRSFLRQMLDAVDGFPYELARRPYRSQRRSGQPQTTQGLSRPTTATRFVTLVSGLWERGYLEQSFGLDCVDDRSYIDISALIEHEIGVPDLWPLSADTLGKDVDLVLDVVEVIGEFVAAPQTRSYHSYSDCGWHHDDFSPSLGRAVYYWQVNRILDLTDLKLRLATDGEDRGRLVEIEGDGRDDLVEQAITRADSPDRDPVRHAIALFRSRDAAVEDKRLACIGLARVLETRRTSLKAELLRRDEGALFQIANQFDLRHREESQKGDYDPVFLEWIFWWYLATIELTDRINERQTQS